MPSFRIQRWSFPLRLSHSHSHSAVPRGFNSFEVPDSHRTLFPTFPPPLTLPDSFSAGMKDVFHLQVGFHLEWSLEPLMKASYTGAKRHLWRPKKSRVFCVVHKPHRQKTEFFQHLTQRITRLDGRTKGRGNFNTYKEWEHNRCTSLSPAYLPHVGTCLPNAMTPYSDLIWICLSLCLCHATGNNFRPIDSWNCERFYRIIIVFDVVPYVFQHPE